MADAATLEALARQKSANVDFAPGGSKLDKVMAGYDAAKSAVLKYVPSAYEPSFDEAVAANREISQKIEQNSDSIQRSLETGADLPDAYALVMTPQQMRDYFLSQYVLSCAGLGAYATGYAAEAAGKNIISVDDYEMGLDVRLDHFSTLVNLEKNGELAKVLRGEEHTAASINPATTGQLSRMGLQPQKLIAVYRGGGTSVYAESLQGQQLGEVITGTIILIAVIGALIVGGCVLSTYLKQKTEMSATLIREQCNQAAKFGYKDTVTKCLEMNSGLSERGLLDEVFGAKAGETAMKYLLFGGGALLLLMLGPNILNMVAASKERSEMRKMMQESKG